MNTIRIRRLILHTLYNERKGDPLGSIERDALAVHLNVPQQEIGFNIAYLVEKGLIEISNPIVGSRKFVFVRITAGGIDLVEDPNEFNNRFPPQVIVQNILGDKLDITVGDHASNVSVGKGIVQVVALGTATNTLREVCSEFIRIITSDSRLDQEQISRLQEHVGRLASVLAQDELDMTEVRRLRNSLAEIEGKPAVRTSVLFSHDAVTRPIRHAVATLIGIPEGSADNV